MDVQTSAREAALAARVETARAGIALIVVAALGLLVYVAMTWSEPHRAGLIGVALFGCLTGAAPAALGLERVLTDRWVATTWLSWSLSIIAALAVGAALDGGSRSPLIVLFALPLMFSALSYPRR